jgi:hypothetical protein
LGSQFRPGRQPASAGCRQSIVIPCQTELKVAAFVLAWPTASVREDAPSDRMAERGQADTGWLRWVGERSALRRGTLSRRPLVRRPPVRSSEGSTADNWTRLSTVENSIPLSVCEDSRRMAARPRVGQDELSSAKTVHRNGSDGRWNVIREPASFCGQPRAIRVFNCLPNGENPPLRRTSRLLQPRRQDKFPFGIPMREQTHTRNRCEFIGDDLR